MRGIGVIMMANNGEILNRIVQSQALSKKIKIEWSWSIDILKEIKDLQEQCNLKHKKENMHSGSQIYMF